MEYLLFLQGLREQAPDFVNLLFLGLTEFMGSALPVVIGAVIFWCIDKKGGYLIMSCYIACAAIAQIVKNIACVYRPWVLDPRIETHEIAKAGATGYSFPSTHTSITVGFFGGMALWLRKHRAMVVACIAIIVLVGFSRNWLGCHTLQDVLCALALSIAVMLTTNWVLNKVEEKPNYDLIASAIFLVASIAFAAYCTFKAYPMDYDALGNLLVDPQDMVADCYKAFGTLFGISIAWPIERHLIRFSTDGSLKARIVRGVVGCVFLGAALLVGKCLFPLFMGAGLAKFFEYACTVVVGVALYPALFTWFESRTRRG